MFDIATRASTSLQHSLLALPFDWQLAGGQTQEALPSTDWANGEGAPQSNLLKIYQLCCEDTLATAVLISLFTDRRAPADERLPAGMQSRRGWVGDAFVHGDFDARIDRWGSDLWRLYVGKHIASVPELARFAAQEALAWMVRDGLAERIEVQAAWQGDVLTVRPRIWQAESDFPVYDILWATSVRKGVA